MNAFAFYFQDALKYPAADVEHAIGWRVPWLPIVWTSVLISVVASAFVLIAIRFEMPRPHTRQVRTAWIWNSIGLALQAPPLFGIALLLLVMAAGGLDHFRD